MKSSIAAATIVLSFLLTGCGPGKAEREAQQKQREDSIRTTTENATRLRLEKIQSIKENLLTAESEKEGMENRLMNFNVELAAAEDKLLTAKQVQFMRTPAEREEQIKKQSIVIDEWKQSIIKLQKTIEEQEKLIDQLNSEINELNLTSNK